MLPRHGSIQWLVAKARFTRFGLVELVGWMGRVGWEGGQSGTRGTRMDPLEWMVLKMIKAGLVEHVAWIACKGKRSRIGTLETKVACRAEVLRSGSPQEHANSRTQ